MGSTMLAAQNAVPLICRFVLCVRQRSLQESSASCHVERMPRYASTAKGLRVSIVAGLIQQMQIISRITFQTCTIIVHKNANFQCVLFLDVAENAQRYLPRGIPFLKCRSGIARSIERNAQDHEPLLSRSTFFKMPVWHCSQHVKHKTSM